MLKNVDDMDKEIEEIMAKFRNGDMDEDMDDLDDLEDTAEHSEEEHGILMREAIKHAHGEITAHIKQDGEKLRGDLHVKGNNAAALVAIYLLMDRIRNNSVGLTFEDIIGMMRYMEEATNGSERSGGDSE